jgi:MFS family permease
MGGWLVQVFNWPSVFWINLPIGLLALLFIALYVPETQVKTSTKLDWPATVLIVLGLFGISFGLMQAPTAGWHTPYIWASLVGGLACLIALIFVERRSPNPLIPLHIFKSPLVLGSNLLTLCLYFALYGMMFFFVLNLRQVQGLSPIFAGLATLPGIVMITFLSGPAGGWSDRIGPRLQMIAGPVLVSVGMASFLLAGTHANYFAYFLPGQILFGLGMALVIAPLTKSALSVEPQFSGAASGVNNSISRIAAMLAIAILGVVALRVFQTDLEHRLTKSSLPSEVRQQILSQANKLGAIEIPTAPEPVRQEAENIIKNSFVHAFRWVLGITAALALLGAIISALTIPKKLPK